MGKKIRTARRETVHMVQAIVNKLVKFVKLATTQLFVEIFLGLTFLGVAYLLTLWGMSQNIVGYLALVLTPFIALAAWLILSALAVFFYNLWCRVQGANNSKPKNWLIKLLVDRQSPQWSEYQDWLHDIFLARRQMLERKCPTWQVAIITYWRLGVFLTVVSFSRIKSFATSMMRWR